VACDCAEKSEVSQVSEPVTVSTAWDRRDRLGACKVRWGIGRDNYRVAPGLYAVGKPGADSTVLVTANYKLTFDVLRRELGGLDAWILVLDTRGINVWCAAGKGTFGTDELVRCIGLTKLAERVSHHRVIVPQLGAPGIAAHEVRQKTGFSVVYGPVRARDIKAFLAADMKANDEMRQVTFTLRERFVLTPVELKTHAWYLLAAIVIFVAVASLKAGAFSSGAALVLLAAYLAGTVAGPVLLPWLPGRSFSLKGAALGTAVGAGAWLAGLAGGPWESIAWLLLATAVVSFLLMNFTGSSTYTSLSGVRKEMRLAVPMQIAGAVLGVTLWLVGIIRG
jgi:hypothetical protein